MGKRDNGRVTYSFDANQGQNGQTQLKSTHDNFRWGGYAADMYWTKDGAWLVYDVPKPSPNSSSGQSSSAGSNFMDSESEHTGSNAGSGSETLQGGTRGGNVGPSSIPTTVARVCCKFDPGGKQLLKPYFLALNPSWLQSQQPSDLGHVYVG